MTDLEERLGATLAGVADDAPVATGLAEAARRRHRVRRQRRLALGGAAASLAVAAGVVVATGLGGGERAADPTDNGQRLGPGPEPWQTIAEGDARASLPPDWVSVDCPAHEESRPVFAAPGTDPCADGTGTTLHERGDSDRTDQQPGVLTSFEAGATTYWQGYVHVGDWELSVASEDRALTRRILATGRLDGQPVVDGSQWVFFSRGVMSYEIPAWWGVGEDGDRSGYAACVGLDTSGGSSSEELLDPGHFRAARAFGPFAVTVTAPTQAVAQLVMATVVEHPEVSRMDDCAPEDFMAGLLPGESTPGAGAPVEEVEPAE